MESIKINHNKIGNNNIIDDKRLKDNNNNNDINYDEIFNVGKYRKSNIHGYVGFENSSREEVIQKAWKDVLQYKSIKVVKEKVIQIEKDYNNNLFLIKAKKIRKKEQCFNFN